MDVEATSDPPRTWATRVGRALVCVGVAHLVWVGLLWTYLRITDDPGGLLTAGTFAVTVVGALVGVVGGSVLATHLGGWRKRRGLSAGSAFLISWLLAAPLLLMALEPVLPERPPLFGLALGTQLAVLLPWRGAVALLWRLGLPVVADLAASALAGPGEGFGSDIAGGTLGAAVWLALALAGVWLVESRAGEPARREDGYLV